MAYQSIDDVQQQIQEHFQEGDYEAAQRLAEQGLEDFPDYAHLLNIWRVVLAARANEPDRALDILSDAASTGFWYGETLLRKNPSLERLQGLPRFERIVQINKDLQAQDITRHFPLLILRDPQRCNQDGPPCPALLALHGNAVTARDTLPFWQPAARSGWLVGALQSTQALWKGAYIWDDREATETDVLTGYRSLNQQYPVDPARFILAGHSSGADAAAWLSLREVIPARGLLLINPSGPLIDSPDGGRASLMSVHHDFRAYILVGEDDPLISSDAIREFADLLEGSGIACEVETVSNAEHDWAPEYEAGILRALEFLSPDPA